MTPKSLSAGHSVVFTRPALFHNDFWFHYRNKHVRQGRPSAEQWIAPRRGIPAFRGSQLLVSFAQSIALASFRVLKSVDLSRRPADFDLFNAVLSDPEMEAWVRGRLETAAAEPPGAAPAAVTVTTAPTPSRLDLVPSSQRETAWPTALAAWLWKKTGGPSWGIAIRSMRPSLSRSPAARPRPMRGMFQAGPAFWVTSISWSRSPPTKSQAGHVQREIGATVDHVAVGLDARSSQPSLLASTRTMPKPSR